MNSQNELQELLNSSNSILNDSFSIPLEGKINFDENNKKIGNDISKHYYSIKDLKKNNNNFNNIHIIKNHKENNLIKQRTLISTSTSEASYINDSNNNENLYQINKQKIIKLKNNLKNKIIHPNKFIETHSNNNKINNVKNFNNNNIKNENFIKIIPLKYAKKQCRRHSGFNHHKCDIDDCENKKNHKNKKNKKKVRFKNDFIEVINVESWKALNNLSLNKSINIKKIKNQYDCSCLIM